MLINLSLPSIHPVQGGKNQEHTFVSLPSSILIPFVL